MDVPQFTPPQSNRGNFKCLPVSHWDDGHPCRLFVGVSLGQKVSSSAPLHFTGTTPLSLPGGPTQTPQPHPATSPNSHTLTPERAEAPGLWKAGILCLRGLPSRQQSEGQRIPVLLSSALSHSPQLLAQG